MSSSTDITDNYLLTKVKVSSDLVDGPNKLKSLIYIVYTTQTQNSCRYKKNEKHKTSNASQYVSCGHQDRTTFVDGLFCLMADYSIPLSGEDSGMLSTIKTSLDSLSSSTETKKANKSVLLGKFQEELSSEVATLKENILNITQVGHKQRKMQLFSNSGDRKSCPTRP